jgi:hypothetical protein
MSRPNPIVLAATLLAFICLFGGLPFLKGGLYLDTHEADTYHLLDILFRMERGLWPHVDFVTPLGVLSFLPIVAFLNEGFGVGAALLWSQILVAALLWPLVTYAAWSRLPPGLAYYFGIVTLGLVLALTYGGATSGVSISMHYNRWSWAVSFVMLLLALVPSRGRTRPVLDGALIGALAMALLMLKITYFVSLVPPVALALLIGAERRAFVVATISGVVVFGAATMAFGPAHWVGYLADLRNVSSSDVRPFVGVPFAVIVGGPQFVGGVILAALSALFMRRAGRDGLALVFLLLVPGFLYVTYQNFGNDPQWLVLLPVLLLALRPVESVAEVAGFDLKSAMTVSAVAAFALFFPSFANNALSPLKHHGLPPALYLPMLPGPALHQDLFVRNDRAHTMTAEVHLDRALPAWSAYSEIVGRDDPPSFGGVSFPHCELLAGSRAYFTEFTAGLKRAGIPDGSQFLTADILSTFWLFGAYAPLQGGAPWYYADLSGLENADYVLIPKCPFLASVQRIMIRDLNAAGLTPRLELDNELFALFSLDR